MGRGSHAVPKPVLRNLRTAAHQLSLRHERPGNVHRPLRIWLLGCGAGFEALSAACVDWLPRQVSRSDRLALDGYQFGLAPSYNVDECLQRSDLARSEERRVG